MATPKVYGIDATIRELKQVEPSAINQLRKDLRVAVEPVAISIRSAIPGSAPIRGMRHKGRTGWDASQIKTVVKTNFSKKASARGYSIVSIWVGGKKGARGTAALQIADMAGRKSGRKTRQGSALIAKLGGLPSRYVWKQAEQQIPVISAQVLVSLEKTSKQVNKNLVVVK
jgi:hypothetical protein